LSNAGYVKSVNLSVSAASAIIISTINAAFAAEVATLLKLGWRVLRVKTPLKRRRDGIVVPKKGVSNRLRPLKYDGSLTMSQITMYVSVYGLRHALSDPMSYDVKLYHKYGCSFCWSFSAHPLHRPLPFIPKFATAFFIY
jgi:hypothetical protein